jgi:hypothetical protein
MTERSVALWTLATRDIFHAESPDHPSMICLITAVTDAAIEARTITTQISFSFDRQSGIAHWRDRGKDMAPARIDSVTKLPAEIYDALIGLDSGYSRPHTVEDGKLTQAEKCALVFVAGFYPANQL